MKILVTGASGFIGKRLCEALLIAGHYVGKLDISMDEQGEWDGIIHLAAVSRVKDCEADPERAIWSNILLTAQMLQRKFKWFVLVSTNEPPTSVYGLTKRCAEDYAKMHAARGDYTLLILKLTNVYGPGMAQDKLLPRFARREITLHDNVLPFEYVSVHSVVRHIQEWINHDKPLRIATLKLQDGVARTAEELMNVATSY